MRRSLVIAVALPMLGLVVTGPAHAKISGPNGRIAFSRDYPTFGAATATYTMNSDGSDVRPLFTPYSSGSPHWSPDGSQVAVTSGLGGPCDPAACTGNTVIINPDTGRYRTLPPQDYPALGTWCSIWSPDGAHFACEGGNDSNTAVNGIYTIRSSDGGGLTQITSNPGGHDTPIDYSPDGSQIVFDRMDPSRTAQRNEALFVVNLDGTSLRQITPWGFSDDDGSWSPDGTQIAFEHRGSLFVVHPDGTGLTKIPLATAWFAGDFAWSPDGTKIVFLIGIHQTGPHALEGIATANADGTNVQQVTITPTFDHQADWGPHPLTT